jgi:hypothetical protein
MAATDFPSIEIRTFVIIAPINGPIVSLSLNNKEKELMEAIGYEVTTLRDGVGSGHGDRFHRGTNSTIYCGTSFTCIDNKIRNGQVYA